MTLLPTFQKSENDLIKDALAMPLESKIEKAIALLQTYEQSALKLSPDGYYVCDSYGKDSSCIVELAKMAGVKHGCHHNFTTIDPPELIRFGRANRTNITEHRSKHGHLILDRMVEKANPPTRRGRWCCDEYKEHGGDGKAKIIGVRIEESARRAKLWTQYKPDRNGRGGFYICPICYWTEKDVWDFHTLRGLAHCELYNQGHKRLGCVGCPMAGNKRREQFKRWPGYERLWRLGFQRLWEKWHGVPNRKGHPRFFEKYGSPEAFFDWWMEEEETGETGQCVFEDMMSQK